MTEEAFIHGLGGGLMMACRCGADIEDSKLQFGETGTDEVAIKVECACGARYTVTVQTEITVDESRQAEYKRKLNEAVKNHKPEDRGRLQD